MISQAAKKFLFMCKIKLSKDNHICDESYVLMVIVVSYCFLNILCCPLSNLEILLRFWINYYHFVTPSLWCTVALEGGYGKATASKNSQQQKKIYLVRYLVIYPPPINAGCLIYEPFQNNPLKSMERVFLFLNVFQLYVFIIFVNLRFY